MLRLTIRSQTPEEAVLEVRLGMWEVCGDSGAGRDSSASGGSVSGSGYGRGPVNGWRCAVGGRSCVACWRSMV